MRAPLRMTTLRIGSGRWHGQQHLPPGFVGGRRWPAVVVAAPRRGTAGRAGAVYARRMATHGFVAVVIDPDAGRPAVCTDNSHGGPLGAVLDHLQAQDFIDAARLAMLGICAGAMGAVHTAAVDQRLKAVATIAGTAVPARAIPALPRRHATAGRGTAHARARVLPGQAITQAIDRFDLRTALLADALDKVPVLHLQPVMAIVGGRDDWDCLESARALYDRARGPDRALIVVPHATRRDLLQRDACIAPAVARIAPFFAFHLQP